MKNIPILSVFFIVIILFSGCGTKNALNSGDYESAYNSAKEAEKSEILLENMAAYYMLKCANSMTSSSSASDENVYTSVALRGAWYDKYNKELVLYLSGLNNSGSPEYIYYYFSYDNEDKSFDATVLTNLNKIDIEWVKAQKDSFDSVEEYHITLYNVLIRNEAIERVEMLTKDNNIKLSDTAIERINNLYTKGELSKVTLLTDNQF